MVAKEQRQGRSRPAAGRLEGRGRSAKARINRVVVMLDEDDYKALVRHARKEKLPVGTSAFGLMHRALRRMR